MTGRASILAGAAFLSFAAGSAPAMISPCAIESMVSEAVSVVQMSDHQVTGPGDGTVCVVTGALQRVFRGPHTVGDVISVGVPCVSNGLIGPQRVVSPTGLEQSPALELHLTAGDGITAYGWGLVFLDALTDSPARQPMCGQG